MHPRFEDRLNTLLRQSREDKGPIDKGGGPPHDGGMEARVAKLELAVEYIQRDIAELKEDVRAIRTTDFRLLFGAIIFVALGLAGIMAKGFEWF